MILEIKLAFHSENSPCFD